jgi:hypothetical protein
MRARVTLAAVALVLVASVAAGWVFESQASRAAAPAAAGYQVRVTRQGRELASFDLDALKAIGLKKVVVQGSEQEGPTLLSVLERAGVRDFSAVTILGAGARDGGRLELGAEDVGADTVLAVAKRGTVKIAGPRIPSDKRVRDVTEIQVR